MASGVTGIAVCRAVSDLSAILADRDASLTLANDNDMQNLHWDCDHFYALLMP